MAPPGEYTKPVTTTISLGNTPASDGEDKELPTASETHTAQALEAITVVPVKRTGEDTDKSAEPITTTAPQRDNLDTASLTATEEESHKPQTQTGSTDEVWQSHRNPKSDKVPISLTPGTPSKQHVEILMKNPGNRKRKGGSDDEYSRPTTTRDVTTSPTAIEEGTHNLQTQIASTGEVWQRQRNPKSNKTPHSPTPGTSSKQQIEALKETLGNRKRKRGSDGEHLRDTPEAGSIDEFWQSQKYPTSNTYPIVHRQGILPNNK